MNDFTTDGQAHKDDGVHPMCDLDPHQPSVLMDDVEDGPSSPTYQASSPTYQASSPTYQASSPTYQASSSPTYQASSSPTYQASSSSPTDRENVHGSHARRRPRHEGARYSRPTPRAYPSADDIVNALKDHGSPVSDRRLGRWFPDRNITQALMRTRNVRFTRGSSGSRYWEYESDRRVQDFVYKAVASGHSTLSDINGVVRRRLTVVRFALARLERSKQISRSDDNVYTLYTAQRESSRGR